MFHSLTEKFRKVFSGLSGKKVLTEANVSDAARQVRLALLDADVNYSVASAFVQRVKEKSLGENVIRSVSPGDQLIRCIHDELALLMGGEERPLDLKEKPSVIMLCGLQGSGKTTSAVKLALFLKSKKILLAACDLQRPAAIQQLKILSSQAGAEVFSLEGEVNPVTVAQKAYAKAKAEHYDVLIVDTAGRLHIDEALMDELAEIKKKLDPQEVLFVANATLGQQAVQTAVSFNEKIGITGTILTMLDGNARAGAALSIVEMTQKPLKFEGIGEGIKDFRLFHPRSMADRILGMGDVINLVKTAQEHITQEESAALEQKMKKALFTYDDYLKQMGKVKQMGSIQNLLKMVPGLDGLGNLNVSDKEFKKMEAMILSMTPAERMEKDDLSVSRRKRIAKGSGVDIDAVNRLVKGFKQLKQLFKNMPDLKSKKMGLTDIMNNIRR
jgi:signal recognition particle subunit SRP54